MSPHGVGAVIEPAGQVVDEAPIELLVAAISGDGRWVVYEEEQATFQGISLWDGSAGVETSIDTAGSHPAISDDGRWVVYVKDELSEADVYLWDRLNGESRRLSSGEAASGDPSISDDGGVVIWTQEPVSGIRTTVQIWNRSTGAITSIDYNTGVPLLSGNGRYVFRNISQIQETRVDLETGAEVLLDFDAASVSDDGNTMAYSFPRLAPADRYGVGILQIDANASVEIETSADTGRFSPIPRDLVLSGDGTALFFSTAASLVVRDDDALVTSDASLITDTYRWVPSQDSLDFTNVPEDIVIGVSDDGRFALTVGTEFTEIFGRFYGRYEFPPPLTTPDPVDVGELSRPQLTDQVNRLYSAFFLREPDADGLRFWRDRRSAGWTVSQMADDFVGSPEFLDRYGELSNVEFVELIYRNLFDRDPDSDGRAFWTSQLSSGSSRGSVMVEFSESPEYVSLTQTSAPSPGSAQQLWRLYRAYLGRDPDQGGFDFWYTQLANDVALAAVSEQFAQSTEFIDQYGSLDNPGFVDLIYRDVLNRTPESDGRSFWIEQLNQGRSRGSVMLAFSESPEYLRATDSLPG